MKKLLLSIIIITAMCFGAIAQNVDIPDANFKAYLVGNTGINTNGDAEIQVSEARAITGYIDVSGYSIADLTGIEAFTALTELYCSGNQLTSLDVSQNTELMELWCDDNSLNTLVLPISSTLEVLNCQKNSLTSIDVSAHSNLLDLDCQYNLLTTIGLSSNTSLVKLKVEYNKISTLNLSANTLIDYLRCGNNQLTTLDLSSNSALIQVYLHNNSLYSLNMANGNNTIIQTFNTANNTALTCIQVDDVAYSTSNWRVVDLVSSFSVKCASCTVNIPDANFKAYLVGNALINTNGDNEIQCDEAAVFTGAISCRALSIQNLTGIEAFTSIEKLDCDYNNLSTLDLSKNTALQELWCDGNSLSTLDVSKNDKLSDLRCSDNLLTNLDVTLLTNLTSLSCHDMAIEELDLSQNTALTYLHCYTNSLTVLNVANGNNTNMSNDNFFVDGNSNLTCIKVDDATYSTTNWTNIDAGASFSEDCGENTTGLFSFDSNTELTIHPNPTRGNLVIDLPINQIQKVEIFNLMGELISSPSPRSTIDVSDLENGSYLLHIQSNNETLHSRFIKE